MNRLQLARLLLLGGREWPYFLVTYLMTIMVTYLTGVWEFSTTHASQIMNFYSGTIVILPVVMGSLVCCMRGFAFTVTLSKIAFLLGLVLLTTALFLPIIKEAAKTVTKCITCGVFPFGLIASTMIFTTLCCVTAAKVETRRLGMVISEGVVDDPEAIIPMTIFWLVPQYVLLGLAEKSFDEHIENGLKKVMRKTQVMGKIIRAAGFYCGVLSVYVVGKLEPTWIQDTLNTSQLDNYFWLLATMSAVSLLLFLLITVTVITVLWLHSKDENT